jgi:hypothetical protein
MGSARYQMTLRKEKQDDNKFKRKEDEKKEETADFLTINL